MGWAGFNGGAALAANLVASIAVMNTNVCAATSLLVWTCLDVLVFGKPSVIGAVQGMITGLVVITPAAGDQPKSLLTHQNRKFDLILHVDVVPIAFELLLISDIVTFNAITQVSYRVGRR